MGGNKISQCLYSKSVGTTYSNKNPIHIQISGKRENIRENNASKLSWYYCLSDRWLERQIPVFNPWCTIEWINTMFLKSQNNLGVNWCQLVCKHCILFSVFGKVLQITTLCPIKVVWVKYQMTVNNPFTNAILLTETKTHPTRNSTSYLESSNTPNLTQLI